MRNPCILQLVDFVKREIVQCVTTAPCPSEQSSTPNPPPLLRAPHTMYCTSRATLPPGRVCLHPVLTIVTHRVLAVFVEYVFAWYVTRDVQK